MMGLKGNNVLDRPEWAPPGSSYDKRKGETKMHGQSDVHVEMVVKK